MIINEGEVKCDQCNGSGGTWINTKCPKCQGEGKLDWVSNAMGSNGILLWGQKTLKLRNYNGGITIDVSEGVSGTTYPIGTASKPINNLADVKIIAKERGLKC